MLDDARRRLRTAKQRQWRERKRLGLASYRIVVRRKPLIRALIRSGVSAECSDNPDLIAREIEHLLEAWIAAHLKNL
jgi:hypothetical protein